MLQIDTREDCCGCTACAMICAKHAITMIPDKMGFMYPRVNKDLCINCGLCLNVCTFNMNYDVTENLEIPKVYATRHKDIKEVLSSQSGGMFIAISDFILSNDGAIYGVGFDEQFRIIHKRTTSKEGRDEFKGSKYVQSDLSDIFFRIKNDLKNNQTVLFSGTPCQTSGLKSYLNLTQTDTQHLYLCDIICHGVPSPNIWEDYISYIKKISRKDIKKINFRNKEFGWKSYVETYILSNGKQIIRDTFVNLFVKNIMLRPSCGNCKYANLKRPSDITLGDFWGWWKYSQEFMDDLGISLTIVNTPKGELLFNKIRPFVNSIESNTVHCLQRNLQNPTQLSEARTAFEHDYKNHGFMYVAKKYKALGWHSTYRALRRLLKQILKKWKK